MKQLLTSLALALSLVLGASLFGAAVDRIAVLSAPLGSSALAQSGANFVINLRKTDIATFAEQVSDITGRTLILDPAVRGEVTVISTEPLDAEGVWALFQSVLRTYGYAALRSGDVWRVVQQANLAQNGGLDAGPGAGSQDFITLLVRLKTLPSESAVQAVKPFVASFGALQPISQPNGVIITDTAENVRRVNDLLLALDDLPGREVGVITLRYANAAEVGQVVRQILGQDGFSEAPQVAVDERSNTLLFRGDRFVVAEMRELAASLDTPGGAAPTTRVFRLRFGDAETVTEILQGVLGGGEAATNPIAAALPTPDAPGAGGDADSGIALGDTRLTGGRPSSGGDITIQASTALNAIVVRGTPSAIAEAGRLIAQLDIRRPQVLIEAAIVELSGDTAEQLGIQFGAGDAAIDGAFAATSFSLTGLASRAVLATLGVPAAVSIANEGLSAGIGVADGFSILVQALGQSSKANLLSTPSLTTLDNATAEIVVAQNVPFLTGTFSPSGNSNDIFSTIERQDVGIILRVSPRILEGDVIRLDVSQEVSSLVNANLAGAVDLITNRRSIETTVLADDGGTIVLGGLITDDQLANDSKVPVLGDIPVLGNLFKSQSQTNRKQTLFVFLRATVLRNGDDITRSANEKFDRLQRTQAEATRNRSLLLNPTFRSLPLEIEGLY